MQVIVEVAIEVAAYAKEQFHRRIRAPSVCPNCGRGQTLQAHGYYWRWVTEALRGQALRIAIRRFFVEAVR